MAILEVKNVDKRFPGVKALDNVSMSVEEGEIRGLIGPNGSGKTTIIRTIIGFYKQDSGKIIYHGEDLARYEIWDRVKKGFSLTYQNPKYVSGFSIFRHIELGALNKNLSRNEILEIAASVGLEDKVEEDPSELPVLAAKRLEIAKALSTNPKVLMLDEIFAGLSYEEGEQVIGMLKNLGKEKKLTILLIDHNLRMVKQMVDKTTVINMGKIIAEGSFEQIIEDEEVKEAYIG